MVRFFVVLLLSMVAALGSSGAQAETRTIYLTFDDGPLQGSQEVLDVITRARVPAAFFLVGRHAEAKQHRAFMAALRAEPLVTIANHTYTHANGQYKRFYENGKSVVADMDRATKALGLQKPVIARLAGRDVYRLPGLASDDRWIPARQARSEKPVWDMVEAAGYYLYGWDHEWRSTGYGPQQSVSQMLREIDRKFSQGMTRQPGHLILLTHDNMFAGRNNRAKLLALIDALKDEGYAFGRIEAYPLQRLNPAIAAGAVRGVMRPASAR